jgi:hypothetical protein
MSSFKKNVIRNDAGKILSYDSKDTETGLLVHHEFAYDAFGNKVAYKCSNGEYSFYRYDSEGNMILSVNGHWNTHSYCEKKFDKSGRIVERISAYDNGKLLKVRNEKTETYFTPFMNLYWEDVVDKTIRDR